MCNMSFMSLFLLLLFVLFLDILSIVKKNGVICANIALTVDFSLLFTQMLRTLLVSSQVRCEVQNFIMKFTSKFVNKASNWLLEQEQPIKCSVYKLVCESHYELLNFTTNLRISERSSEHLREK